MRESHNEKAELTLQLSRQKADEQDVYYYLHKKLDRNHEIISKLKTQLVTCHQSQKENEARAQTELEHQRLQYEGQIQTLRGQLMNSEMALEQVNVFQKQKDEIELRVDTLEAMLAQERQQYETVCPLWPLMS